MDYLMCSTLLDIRDGYYFALHATSSTKRHLDAAQHANETSKKKRLSRKLFKARQAEQHAAKEGVLHEEGCLNG